MFSHAIVIIGMLLTLVTIFFSLRHTFMKEDMTMKKEYSALELEVIAFEQADVITASGVDKEPTPTEIN